VFLAVIFSSSFVIFFISGIFNVCGICLFSMFRIVLALHLWRQKTSAFQARHTAGGCITKRVRFYRQRQVRQVVVGRVTD